MFHQSSEIPEIFGLSKAAPNVFGAYSECRNHYYYALRFVQKTLNDPGFLHQLKVCDFSEDANSSTMDVSFIVIFLAKLDVHPLRLHLKKYFSIKR